MTQLQHLKSVMHILRENMEEGFVIQDADGRIFEFNKAALSILGLTEAQLLGRDSMDPRWKAIRENFEPFEGKHHPAMQALATGQKIIGKIMGVHRADGQLCWISINAIPIFSGDNPRPEGVIATFQDVTNLLNAEREKDQLIAEALAANERLATAVKAVSFGVWDWNMKDNTILWSDLMYELTGLARSDFHGKVDEFFQLVHPEDAPRVELEIQESFADSRDFHSEFRVIRPIDGKVRILKGAGHGTVDGQGKPLRLVGVNWDITDQRENEHRLNLASKMSSLGEMAAGVAHEINNPLMIIRGAAEQGAKIIERGALDLERLQRGSRIIVETVDRIARIVKSLRTFAREGNADPFEPNMPLELINDTINLGMERFKQNDIAITVNCSSDDIDKTFDCRASQVSQIILNLLNNSFDAIATLTGRWIRIDVQFFPDTLQIRFTDSGSGIPVAIQEKIMQPFFTTKDVGKGTGLGLSLIAGLMRSHNGTITLDTASPNTSFLLTFPIHHSGTTTGPT